MKIVELEKVDVLTASNTQPSSNTSLAVINGEVVQQK